MLVAGFQGVSSGSSDVTTLGRGGSDTTAVALAAALGARGVRDLHRRRRRLQRRPAHRARRAQAGSRLLRGDARDGGLGRGRAAAALGRVRAQPRRAHPLPLVLRRRPGTVVVVRRREHGSWSGPSSPPSPTRPPRRWSTLLGVPDTAGRRRRASSRRWPTANVNVDMIDPERARLRGRPGRDLLHGAPRGPARPRARRSSRSPARPTRS